MELKPLNGKELDDFVSSQEQSQFLQSWAWGEFQKSLNRQVWRYGVYLNADELSENKEAAGAKKTSGLIASASFIQHLLGLKKSYLYCPRGPVFNTSLSQNQKTEALKLLLSKARDLTSQTKNAEEVFFRYEPTTSINLSFADSLNKETKPIQPPDTLLIDLRKTAAEILHGAHAKTRYNIRLAEKSGIKIFKLPPEQFTEHWPLFLETGHRSDFNLFPKDYYEQMLKLMEIELWVAQAKDNAIIAASLISFYGDTATYLHGASDYLLRRLMAPHLLQWTLIKTAQDRGCKYYDFHGIAPQDQPNHPWAGVSRFKKGFGGKQVSYPGTFDFIYQPGWYKIYKYLRKINRLIR